MSRVPPNLDITHAQWLIIERILKTFMPDKQVKAFGSRVRGTAKPYSDLDLAIITDQPLSIDSVAQLAEAFSESDLPWKVDLVDWSLVNDTFRDIIEKEGVVLPIGQ
ncbi:nucleotidyltransferase family protein [Marinimicrobium agarilyticum]|uniref:nucleotidyltransferase family protein n=1 Tax=Marinimicrobium agarilyticum TaxID=306546 RepID=UPI00040C8046|nr:nucleotidyltransferase domain-containing protein [Marinimicrobium agarilyticum]